MRKYPLMGTFYPSFFTVFLISLFIVFAIMEFRHTKNLITQYETGIQQIALNNTNLFLKDINKTSASIAKKIDLENQSLESSKLLTHIQKSYLVQDLYILDINGNIVAPLNTHANVNKAMVKEASNLKNYSSLLSPVHFDSTSKTKVVTSFTPLQAQGNKILAIDFHLEDFQHEMLHELMSKNYSIAVFDHQGNAVVWPFNDKQLAKIGLNQDTFIYENKRYNVFSAHTDSHSWNVYFFFQANNIEIFRAVTILLLVFALYVCLYELLVEYWGVNTAKTYFENIDFAIFNQINEGVIIANNSGRVVFANETAHRMFADRKKLLRNVRLKEILGNQDLQKENYGSLSFSLKLSERLLKAIHSPIIKNNKILGSLTVIRNEVVGDNFIVPVMDKVFESIPQGIIFVNKEHEISHANLIAKCFFANLITGASIEVVDRELANFIYKNIDSQSVKRVKLSSGIDCEVTPVLDDDGIYVGTVIYILSDTVAC